MNLRVDYFRKDQANGISAPDLSKECTYAEHIVRARGKRTQLTSISQAPDKINDFGPILYQAIRESIDRDNHSLIEHKELMEQLRSAADANEKEERARAIQALRYAKRRLEGLIEWNFPISGIDRKDLITWAFRKVQEYFEKA